jgi:hypothetical protein
VAKILSEIQHERGALGSADGEKHHVAEIARKTLLSAAAWRENPCGQPLAIGLFV